MRSQTTEYNDIIWLYMMFLRWWQQYCFILTYLKTIFAKQILRWKNFEQKLRHHVVEADAI